jgi:hypothetical protein
MSVRAATQPVALTVTPTSIDQYWGQDACVTVLSGCCRQSSDIEIISWLDRPLLTAFAV